jgi:hypothetical protein
MGDAIVGPNLVGRQGQCLSEEMTLQPTHEGLVGSGMAPSPLGLPEQHLFFL